MISNRKKKKPHSNLAAKFTDNSKYALSYC